MRDDGLKPKTNAEISKIMKEQGVEITPQRIGQRKKAIELKLRAIFNKQHQNSLPE
jgi:hypothetical protein